MTMTVIRAVRRSLRATLEMALPTTCGGCREPGATWCAGCAQVLHEARFPAGSRQVSPRPCPVSYPPTWAATAYATAARAALVAFKDGDRRDLAGTLAPLLADAMAAALATDLHLKLVLRSGNGPVLVVPVPSSRSAVRRRGDAPLELLTRAAVARLARADREIILSPALRLGRRVADQAGLDRRQRAGNLERAMQVQPRWLPAIRGASCLLVDDVVTTGATLVEAARALSAGGAGYVAAATVAATQRRAPLLDETSGGEDAPARSIGQT